jgi:glycosyltransferase involved in cell wall biosynthesis
MVAIHPPYHEGIANVLLETASTSRPALASNIPGCKETFDAGVSGFGFEVRNTLALVSAIEKFIELPYEEKNKMGIAGRAKVEHEFDRQIVVDAYMKEINKIVYMYQRKAGSIR